MTSEPAPAQAFVMVALGDDTSPANGCLRVLPGSHRGRHPLHALLPEAHSDQAERVPADHPAFADQPGEVAVPLRRGDVAVTDVRLPRTPVAGRWWSPTSVAGVGGPGPQTDDYDIPA